MLKVRHAFDVSSERRFSSFPYANMNVQHFNVLFFVSNLPLTAVWEPSAFPLVQMNTLNPLPHPLQWLPEPSSLCFITVRQHNRISRRFFFTFALHPVKKKQWPTTTFVCNYDQIWSSVNEKNEIRAMWNSCDPKRVYLQMIDDMCCKTILYQNTFFEI